MAGALSVGATLALAGGMAVGTRTIAKASTKSNPTTRTSSESDDASSDDGSSLWSQFNVPAQSGSVSPNPVTSTHAS